MKIKQTPFFACRSELIVNTGLKARFHFLEKSYFFPVFYWYAPMVSQLAKEFSCSFQKKIFPSMFRISDKTLIFSFKELLFTVSSLPIFWRSPSPLPHEDFWAGSGTRGSNPSVVDPAPPESEIYWINGAGSENDIGSGSKLKGK